MNNIKEECLYVIARVVDLYMNNLKEECLYMIASCFHL